MKVLYALEHYPALSESYIRTEIEWMRSCGVEVSVWSRQKAASPYRVSEKEWIIGPNKISKAILDFSPDIVHAHWLGIGREISRDVRNSGRPMTVRGHSFDMTQESVDFLDRESCVKKIWVFPHFSKIFRSEKVAPLPVCHGRETPAQDKNFGMVFRAAAGLPGKGLEEFFLVASLVPEFDFHLAVTRSVHYPKLLLELKKSPPSNLTIYEDLEREKVFSLMDRSAIFLRGHDPSSHLYGMPVSIAEAMASGCLVVARRDFCAYDYIGGAGVYYSDSQGAIEALKEISAWDKYRWQIAWETSVNQAGKYSADIVLPEVLNFWKSLI